MSVTNKSKGFGLTLLVVVVGLIVLAGFIVWQTYITKQTPDDTISQQQNKQKSQQQEPDPNLGYIVIKEWGVRFKPVDGFNDAIYKAWPTKGIPVGDGTGIPLPDGSVEVVLSTQGLANLSTDCSVEQNATAVWRLYRSSKQEVLHTNVTLGKVGDYYYYYFRSQGACVVSENDFGSNGIAARQLFDSFKTLEIAR